MNVTLSEKYFSGKWGALKLVLFILLTWIIPAFGGYKYDKTLNNQVTVNIDPSDKNSAFATAKPEIKAYSNCEMKSLKDFENDWDVKRYPKKNGQYCSSRFASYPFPDLTYKNDIPYGTNGLKFSYKNSVDDGSNPLVVSLGSTDKDIRFFIQETNPQIVGVEIFDDNFKRFDPIILKDIPKINTEIEMQVRGNVNSGNEVTYILNLNYISSLTTEKREESFSYNVKTADTNPLSFNATIAVGKGGCLKPTGYGLCE